MKKLLTLSSFFILATLTTFSFSKELNLTCVIDNDVTFDIFLNINNTFSTNPGAYAGHVTLVSDKLFHPFKVYQEEDLKLWSDVSIRAMPLVVAIFKDTYDVKAPHSLPFSGIGGAFNMSLNRKTLLGEGSYNSARKKWGMRKKIDFKDAPCNLIALEEENVI